MKTLNLEMKEVHVEPRTIKTDFSIKMGTPIFAMCKSARKFYGLKKDKKYRKWQKEMKKLWKRKNIKTF